MQHMSSTHQWGEEILVEFVVSNVVAVDVVQDRIDFFRAKEADAERRSLEGRQSDTSSTNE